MNLNQQNKINSAIHIEHQENNFSKIIKSEDIKYSDSFEEIKQEESKKDDAFIDKELKEHIEPKPKSAHLPKQKKKSIFFCCF